MTTTTTTTERRDFGHVYLRGALWWIRYSVGGKRYRESTGSTSRREAEKILARRQAELGIGALVAPDAKRLTFADLAQMIRDDYRVQGRRTLTVDVVDGREHFGGALADSLTRLERFFGTSRALAITTDRVTAYERDLLGQGYARATVNKDLAALRRAFNLAVKARRLPLSAKPSISTPDPRNARQGFFEPEDFRAVLAALPEPLRPVMQFCYLTGWRPRDEVLPLTWAQVDFGAGTVRLEPNTTKNFEGRSFPFDVLPALRDLLEQQRAHTKATERRLGVVIPWVFHRDGKPIKSYDGAWRSACQRAAVQRVDGIEVVVRPALLGRIVYDFRRSAVRNLERAGVSRSVAMSLTGHKTEAVYRRYAIVDSAAQREGVEKLARLHDARGTLGAQSGKSAGGAQ